MAAADPIYVKIADLPLSSTGKRRVLEFHLDDNHDALNLLIEILVTTLFEAGGPVVQGSFSLSGTVFSIDSLHAGITLDRNAAILAGSGTYDVGSVVDGKHRLVLAAIPTTATRTYTDPETGETISDDMPTGWGVLQVVQGDTSDYPDIANHNMLPVIKFEMSSGSVSSWGADADYVPLLARTPRYRDGATADRPGNPIKGEMFFDTDLGKPIWYNGTGWVDATGGSV